MYRSHRIHFQIKLLFLVNTEN